MKNPTKTQYRIRNWREYNQSLVNRGSLTLWVSEEVIAEWHTTGLSGGRGASQHYSDLSITCMLTLQAIYGLRLRQTEGLMRSIVQLLGVELDVADYSTLCRRRKHLAVSLQTRSGEAPRHVVFDSTGVKVAGEGEWKVRQHGYTKRRTWLKVHLGVDEATDEVVAMMATTNSYSDGEVFAEMLDQIEGEISQVSGDGAYDKTNVYEAINDRNAEAEHSVKTRVAIPPQRNAKIWKHGNTKGERHARDENLRGVRTYGRAEWKRRSGYHRRSKAETAMFRFKTIFGDRLGARLFESQACEIFIKCVALNTMTALGGPESYRVT